MARELLTEINALIGWTWNDDTPGLAVSDTNQLKANFSYSDGTGSDEADRVWHSIRTLAGGGDETLDLTALLTSLFTDSLTISMAAIKGILIINNSETNSLQVGNAASNAWQGPFGATNQTLEVPPGCPLLLSNRATGWPVHPTEKNLKITNLGLTATQYQIAIVGRGASTSSSSSSSSSGA